jgi:hypothetical protein
VRAKKSHKWEIKTQVPGTYRTRVINRNDDWEEKLQAIYAEIPTGFCKGLCQEGCCSLGMWHIEAALIRKYHTNLPVASDINSPCSALTEEGKCGIYNERPSICRAWGATAGHIVPGGVNIDCPFGCVPEEGTLSKARVIEIFGKIKKLNEEYGFPGGSIFTSGWRITEDNTAVGRIPTEDYEYLQFLKKKGLKGMG